MRTNVIARRRSGPQLEQRRGDRRVAPAGDLYQRLESKRAAIENERRTHQRRQHPNLTPERRTKE